MIARASTLSLIAVIACSSEPSAMPSHAGTARTDAGAKEVDAAAGSFDNPELTDGTQPGTRAPGAPVAKRACVERFPASPCQRPAGPWGEALQKALWFFHANRSGSGITCTKVQWRGDAHTSDAQIELRPNTPNGVDLSQGFIDEHRALLDPDGDGEVDLSGGFYDAGDYIKFGLTTGYSAAMLAWSSWEFPEAYRNTNLEPELFELLRWFSDYMMRSSFIDASGKLVAFAHQVGDATDHTCGWMPPEVRRADLCPRKGYFVSAENPAADVTASAAAALALTALVIRPTDAAYAEKAIRTARALYAFAAQYPTAKATADGGLYTSEYAADDLAWAAVWLHEATGDLQYLDDTLKPGGWLEGFPGFQVSCLQWDTSCWSEAWTQCWNSVRSGVFLKLAQSLDHGLDGGKYAQYAPAFTRIAKDNALAWAGGSVARSPAGFSFLAGWGSGRYNAAAQFVTLVYAKHFGERDPEAADDMRSWSMRQIDYLLGDNPRDKSYVMGFSDSYANQPHHAAGHASTSGQPDEPPENRHIIWGALVNGPADAQDGHVDRRSDYGSNEVAIDYNASLVAALAAQYALRGGEQCGLPDFPPLEPKATEFFTRSMQNGSSQSCRSQVDVTLINHTVHPPRYDEHLRVRYYFDIAELLAQGKSIEDVSGNLINDNGSHHGEPTRLTGPHPCPRAESVYYFELDYEGYRFWGELPQLHAPRRLILELGEPYGADCDWDPKNDFSHAGLGAKAAASPHIPVFSKNVRVWGEVPVCGDDTPDVPPPEVPPPPAGNLD